MSGPVKPTCDLFRLHPGTRIENAIVDAIPGSTFLMNAAGFKHHERTRMWRLMICCMTRYLRSIALYCWLLLLRLSVAVAAHGMDFHFAWVCRICF
jgi:hypothetical protein